MSTLERILGCEPPPDEVLVHVDAGDDETMPMLEREFGGRVKWLVASETRGPGGGRNALAAIADGDLLVSLDDDSWPIDPDFFMRVLDLSSDHPQVAAFAAVIKLPADNAGGHRIRPGMVGCFENCGVVIRTSAFLATTCYLPLRYAYGMEEADVALQLIDRGWSIRRSPEIRVFHDSELAHHASAEINAAHITNIGLLGFLRYPAPWLPLALFQVANRLRYSIITGRYAGIGSGLWEIPWTCWKFRSRRQPVKSATIRKMLSIRGNEEDQQ